MRIMKLRMPLLLTLGALMLAPVAHAGDIERGGSISMTCAACHGAEGVSPLPDMYPDLAGQPESELIEKLQGYRSGDLDDPVMQAQAANLSDQDIADLAAYFSAQEPR